MTNSSPSAEITGPASGIVIAVGTPVSLTRTFTDDAGDVHRRLDLRRADLYRRGGRIVPFRVRHHDLCRRRCLSREARGRRPVRRLVGGDPGRRSRRHGRRLRSERRVRDGRRLDPVPPGAYAASPSLTGKANFGFVSKYKRGATTPTGDTEFQFKAGDLNFHSSTYEWLVIAGARAQYKGTGTINGGGSYGFLLSAVDGRTPGGGGADKFRIKITDKTSGVVVYDNMMGAADSSAAATLLGGGSIAVQTNGGKASASISASMTGPEGAPRPRTVSHRIGRIRSIRKPRSASRSRAPAGDAARLRRARQAGPDARGRSRYARALTKPGGMDSTIARAA